MLAAWMEHGHDHQIGIAEEPFLGSSGSFGHAIERSKVLVPRETAKMLAADASQAGDLFLGENLLARLNSDHRRGLPYLRCFQEINCCRISQQ